MSRLLFFLTSCLFLLGCSLETNTQSIPEDYDGPIIEMYNSMTSYSDNSKLRIKLNSNEYFVYKNENEEYPKGLFMEIYSTKENKMIATFVANYVIKFYKENYYKATGNVILTNLESNDVLNTEELLWYPEKEKFVTDKFLTIKTDNELHKGEGMESNQDFSSYRIIKPMGSIQFEEEWLYIHILTSYILLNNYLVRYIL